MIYLKNQFLKKSKANWAKQIPRLLKNNNKIHSAKKRQKNKKKSIENEVYNKIKDNRKNKKAKN